MRKRSKAHGVPWALLVEAIRLAVVVRFTVRLLVFLWTGRRT